jgi:hypothetical protein
MACCEKCGADVPEARIVEVCTAKRTYSSPAEWSDWCEGCARREFGDPECDEDYERAERSDAWEQRGGGGL